MARHSNFRESAAIVQEKRQRFAEVEEEKKEGEDATVIFAMMQESHSEQMNQMKESNQMTMKMAQDQMKMMQEQQQAMNKQMADFMRTMQNFGGEQPKGRRGRGRNGRGINDNGRMTTYCKNCKLDGYHDPNNCYKLEANASKRPAGWKSRL